jgi:hypothetical protein
LPDNFVISHTDYNQHNLNCRPQGAFPWTPCGKASTG